MEKKIPLVSVIVPNYNYARFLKQRIDSILEQTYTDFELILLDDFSSDESLELLEYYRDNQHVSHIEINSQNSGTPFAQWKKGIALARGKYIWIAESDDYADPSFLATAVFLLERNTNASFCFCGGYRVDEFGSKLDLDYDRWTKKQYSCENAHKVFDGTEYISHNMYWRSYIYNASGVLFKRELALRVDTTLCFSMRCSGDWLFWAELARLGQVIEIYKKLNYCRYHQASTSVQAKKVGKCLEEDMVVVEQIEKYIPQLSIYKRTLRKGTFYKKIKRLKVVPNIKRTLFEDLKQRFDGGSKDYFIERANKFLSFIIPCLLTEDRERL